MAGPTGVPVAQTVSTSKPFKQPFHAIAQASHKSGYLTKPVDPAINKTIDVFSSLYKGIKKYVDKFPKIHPYILLFIALVVSGTVSFFLLIPAVIFFPITIALGIGTAFAAVALGPLVFIGSWLLISSAPAQAKIVKPFLDETLKNQKVAKFLLLE